MAILRTLIDLLSGPYHQTRRHDHETDAAGQTTPLTSKDVQFWRRDPNSKCPWWFSPPDLQNGCIFYFFANKNDVDYPCVQPVLDILAEKFDAQVQ